MEEERRMREEEMAEKGRRMRDGKRVGTSKVRACASFLSRRWRRNSGWRVEVEEETLLLFVVVGETKNGGIDCTRRGRK